MQSLTKKHPSFLNLDSQVSVGDARKVYFPVSQTVIPCSVKHVKHRETSSAAELTTIHAGTARESGMFANISFAAFAGLGGGHCPSASLLYAVVTAWSVPKPSVYLGWKSSCQPHTESQKCLISILPTAVNIYIHVYMYLFVETAMLSCLYMYMYTYCKLPLFCRVSLKVLQLKHKASPKITIWK